MRPAKFTQREGRKAQNNWARAFGKPLPFPDADVPRKERLKHVGPTEHSEQVKVIRWWRQACAEYGLPEIALYATPNASKRSYYAGNILKAEGMRRGVLDLTLAVPRGKWHGMAAEMKYGKGSLTPEQREYIVYLSSVGYHCATYWTGEDAIAGIKMYLQLEAI